MHVYYLHGFASSPASSKAAFFRERLAKRGMDLHCPDFSEPVFSTLTVSRMLQQLDRQIAALPSDNVVLIGSSLGGFVAVEAAARQIRQTSHPISHLVLLAPAIELEWEKWDEVNRYGLAAWCAKGEIEMFHYAHNEQCSLKFDFYEDAKQYCAAARVLDQRMLIFQGRWDESVTPSLVEKFAKAQPNATLHMVDDGHQLRNNLDFIWQKTAAALQL